MNENDNLDEYTPEPLTTWDLVHLAILGVITALWVCVLVKIVGWIVWVVKEWF